MYHVINQLSTLLLSSSTPQTKTWPFVCHSFFCPDCPCGCNFLRVLSTHEICVLHFCAVFLVRCPFSSSSSSSSSELWIWWLSGGKRGDFQNCSVLYCVLKLCTVINTLRWAVLTVLWLWFCLTGPISLCLDSCVFMFVFLCLSCHTA